jgi:hypothetical protein
LTLPQVAGALTQQRLGHREVTTTQISDNRRRQTSSGASHDVPI